MSRAAISPSLADFVAAFSLYRDAILCGVVAGLVLGYLGVYVVLRRLIFVPLAVTHASAFGVTLAFLLQLHIDHWVDPIFGAVAALLTTFALLFRPRRVTSEGVIALIYVLSAAGAVLFGTRITQEAHEVSAIIFGTAVAVYSSDLYATLGMGTTILTTLVWLRRGLVFACFDPEGARVQRLPVRLLEGVLLVAIGLMVSVTTRALGALPVFSFCVLPAIAALRVVRRIGYALALAGCIGALSAALGYIGAFFLALPVGASQSAVAALVTALSMLGAPLWRR